MLEFSLVIALIVSALLLSFLVINHLFIYVFLYIEYGLINLKDPESYPRASLKRYLRNCCLEFLYVNGKYFLLPFKFFNLTKNTSKNSTAILLIHGYNRNQTDWLWFIRQLASNINYPIYTVNLAPAFGSIQQITENSLKTKISQIKQQTDCQELILVTHSMGGLVASYYSEFIDEHGLVKNIITIGTPFSGTKLSVAASGANSKQMLPGAKFTEELRAKISRSYKWHYQIASHFDNIVFPWTSALLESTPKTQQLILPFESHLGMLHSKVVMQQVIDWINEI